ncbi:hypothetical protein [Pseudorhodoferax sp. Leaf267]|uniref:hypothetical protein n=1 Tax=Pseudorhodoferax sp. Leaf267 TaxID=1736316 RepID=UPI0006FDED48|nr:hypothetical protein [Pseudorhodoferax sp. Leaf267]KQP17014.1 hypothetical protein ASF43_29500 [Pseudorhodoferax sp. Leaf267]
MQAEPNSLPEPAVHLPVVVVAELQDSLMVVMHDLQRLDGLLAHTMDNLMERFDTVSKALADPEQMQALAAIRASLHAAVTELQFQDMASQLITHTTKVLQGCAYRLAAETMGNEPDEEAAPFGALASERPNPVTQSEMDAGSIELF